MLFSSGSFLANGNKTQHFEAEDALLDIDINVYNFARHANTPNPVFCDMFPKEQVEIHVCMLVGLLQLHPCHGIGQQQLPKSQ
eukprot:1755937-Amphidinium_carterae.1